MKSPITKKKKILFISWTVPPIGGSHGHRVSYFLKYINEFSHRLDVLTILPTSDFPLFDLSSLKFLLKSINIQRVSPGFISKIYYKKASCDALNCNHNLNERNVNILNKTTALFLKKIKFVVSETNILWLVDWTLPAIQKGVKLIKRYNHNILMSSGNAEAHVVAYIIKLLNKDVAWIVDYGDPWLFAPNYMDSHTKVKILMDHWLEKRILKSASIITVTTEETKKNYLENYPFLEKEKIKVIPMGIDYDAFKKIRAEHSEKFRILYTGSIYPTRDIKPFINAVKTVSEDKEMKEKIEVLFVGNIENKFKELVICMGLEDMISFGGFVPYEKSLSLIMGADVLLSFGNKGGLQVPGKLFDYVGSKRPILWIKGDEGDPALRYLEDINRAIIADNDSKDIYSKLLILYNLSKKQEFRKNFNLEDISDFSWKKRGELLEEICSGLIDDENN